MTDEQKIEGEFEIKDEGQPQTFGGKGFKIVMNTVNTPIQTGGAGNVDRDRDVTQTFKDNDGRCLICELPCDEKNCLSCSMPGFSEMITTEVLRSITSHKSPAPGMPIFRGPGNIVIKKEIKKE